MNVFDLTSWLARITNEIMCVPKDESDRCFGTAPEIHLYQLLLAFLKCFRGVASNFLLQLLVDNRYKTSSKVHTTERTSHAERSDSRLTLETKEVPAWCDDGFRADFHANWALIVRCLLVGLGIGIGYLLDVFHYSLADRVA